MENKKCPKCEGEMKRGNVAGRALMQFMTGDPNKLFGLVRGVRKTNAYMCQKCGFIEMYGELEKGK